MKRICWLLCLLLCLALTGCGLGEEQESEEYVYTGTYFPVSEHPDAYGEGDALDPQQRSVVKTILSYNGELPYSYPTEYYSYQLPMIDLAGEQALGCNQEIENRFGTLIRESMEAMETGADPVLRSVSYSCYTLSDILTLRIDQVDFEGQSSRAYYTVDAKTGESVSMEELFAAAGLNGNPKDLVNEAVNALFTRRFGPLDPENAAYTTALNRTQTALSPLGANRMHLAENGSLVVAVELFAPGGGSSVEELTLP